MPYAAISTGDIDLILEPRKIPAKIGDLYKKTGTRLLDHDQLTPDEDDIERILLMLLAQTGSDFRDYKRTTLLRRLERRMTVQKCQDLADYLRVLEGKPEELYELHNDILITVTSFFRDSQAFEALRLQLSDIITNDGELEGEGVIRVWVAGCATGEEAYSIAILIAEHLGDRLSKYKVQIFGTDLNEHSLVICRQALYPSSALTSVPDHLIAKYCRDPLVHKLVC